MDQEKLNELEKKIDAIYVSVEKTRKYILTVFIISIVAFIAPLLGLISVIPAFLRTLNDVQNLGI